MIAKIVELIAAGIADGALSRFVLAMVAAGMLVHLTNTNAVSSDAALSIVGTVIGYFFGAQSKGAGS